MPFLSILDAPIIPFIYKLQFIEIKMPCTALTDGSSQ